ncbi:MAG TPA: Gfo/Idh/MocA family oxidoreductase [Candidatus Dormibacteraeota bacterium]|nr:Gfo/Idh/MocA family oxidoreductase [Candidatus Dormibacteraeota bacterium]
MTEEERPTGARRLTASVVGAGAGGSLSIDALTALDEYELVAVADLRLDVRRALEERLRGVRTFEQASEMFAACPTDVVCVSTYASTHEEIALMAMRGPVLGMLLEKPLSYDVGGARRLLDAVKGRDLPAVVPHGMLTRGTPLAVKARIDAGDIGRVRVVEIESRNWDLINAGIHWLHFTLTVLADERVTDVLAAADTSTHTYRDGMQVETESLVQARTDAGTRIFVNSGDHLPTTAPGRAIVLRFIGTGGVAEFWGWEQGFALITAQGGDQHPATPAEPALIGHARYLRDLAGMIASGKRDYRGAERSIAALEVIEAAYLSAHLGCNVRLPLDAFVPPDSSDWHAGQPYGGQGGGRDGRRLEEGNR